MSDAAALLSAQREAQRRDGAPDRRLRLDRLDRLRALLIEGREEWGAAVSADFGHRSRHEILLTELVATLASIDHARRHLRRWMRPERRRTALAYWPARNAVHYQPLGVIGIVSPWNYPVNLAFSPLAGALAAGNRVLLKPSEITPRVAALIAERVARRFQAEEIAVVTGDAGTARRFTELPFDHLVFTGSTATGRLVMQAAARNLVPVTLELGGKSPAIVAPDAVPGRAAGAIMRGKLINAGQSCVAPDHIYVPRQMMARFVAAADAAVRRLYPSIGTSPDYGAIVDGHRMSRLLALLDDAVEKGASALPLGGGDGRMVGEGRLRPHLLIGVDDGMSIMREEIFGPLLPVLPYDDMAEVLARIGAGPRPLALYLFTEDAGTRRRVLDGTLSGGVCINDTMLQVGQEDLPFGGVGMSGMGAYHGRAGFLAFSHARAVMEQARLNPGLLARPPYGRRIEWMIDLLLR